MGLLFVCVCYCGRHVIYGVAVIMAVCVCVCNNGVLQRLIYDVAVLMALCMCLWQCIPSPPLPPAGS